MGVTGRCDTRWFSLFLLLSSELFDVASCLVFEAVCGADLSCVEVELGMDRSGVGIQFIWRELGFRLDWCSNLL